MRRVVIASTVVCLASCARAPARSPATHEDEAEVSTAELAEGHPRELERPTARRLFVSPAQDASTRFRARTLASPDRELPPLGSRRVVDVRFADAELEEALRLLSEAGGFAFIAEGELAGRVTTELRRVTPYDALVAIAEAHGARVERRGGIVVVRPGRR